LEQRHGRRWGAAPGAGGQTQLREDLNNDMAINYGGGDLQACAPARALFDVEYAHEQATSPLGRGTHTAGQRLLLMDTKYCSRDEIAMGD